MVTRLEKLNQRIQAKLAELQDDREERRETSRLLARKDARIADLRDALRQARKRIKRRRAAIREVLADLETYEATPEVEEAESKLKALRDQLAGELEEAIATRDRILVRIDRQLEAREDAREALEAILRESDEDREALERMRERRRRMREAQDRPSPSFSWAEFDCNDGTPAPMESRPAIRHWCETIGEPARERFGPIHINSAYRHRAYNARIGGEDNSVHIYDFPGRDFKAVAVDWKAERGTPADWFAFTAGKADGRGLYSTFHHADTRNRIGWPDATWRG